MKLDTSHRKQIVLVSLMFAGALIALLRFNTFQVGSYFDDAHYIVLAESLASGRGFSLINFPNAPAEWAFPPGWPLLLAPFTALSPGNYEVLKLVAFALWLASIPLMYRLFASRIETPYLEVVLALVVLNPGMINMPIMVMSEAAYLFFSMLALYLFDMWERQEGAANKARYWLLLLATVVAGVYTQLIRTVGISVLLMFVTYLASKRRFREMAIVAGLIMVGLLPQLWFNTQNGGTLISTGYQSQVLDSSLAAKLGHMGTNLQSYADGMITKALIPLFGPSIEAALSRLGLGIVPLLASVLTLLLVAAGGVLSWVDFRTSVLYVGFYLLGILSFWNPIVGSAQERFLLPIIPFLYFFFVRGTVWTVKQTIAKTEKRTIQVVLGITAIVLLLSIFRNVQEWQNPLRNRITDISAGSVWIARTTPQDAVIMARNPVPTYLFARRSTVAFPTPGDDIEQYLRANGIDYVLISPELQVTQDTQLGDYVEQQLLPLLQAQPDTYELLYSDPTHNVSVFAVHHTS